MNKKPFVPIHVFLCLIIVHTVFAKPKAPADTLLDKYNVLWDTPCPGSAQSMPLGNGDIGLNLWVEKNGDLIFYISKTDAWGGELAA